MKPAFPFRFRNRQLWLSAESCIYWEEQQSLILSDLHFGKIGHFRKSGIAVPQSLYREDLQRLVTQIQYFQPRQLIVVGDLFHSQANKELELFRKWRKNFPEIEIHLIRGNHDILKDDWYADCEISVIPESMILDGLRFIHDIELMDSRNKKTDASFTVNYSFSGHIHPGIRVSGAGKQSICLPCFYFSENYAVIPAFSRFTGVALVQPESRDTIFAIVEDRVMQLQ